MDNQDQGDIGKGLRYGIMGSIIIVVVLGFIAWTIPIILKWL